MTELNKIPPQDLNLEETLLCTMISAPSIIDDIAPFLKPEIFYDAGNQIIFNNLFELWKENVLIDYTILINRLKKSKVLTEVGGTQRLLILSKKFTHNFTYNAEKYAMILAELYIKRELIKYSYDLNNQSYDDSKDISDILGYSNEVLEKIYQFIHGAQGEKTSKEVSEIALQEANLRNKYFLEGRTLGIRTPLKDMNHLTNGWQKQDLIIVAARPSVGKTALTLSAAFQALIEKLSVVIFSIEMPAERLFDRMACGYADVDFERYRQGNLTVEDWKQLNQFQTLWNTFKVTIEDKANITIDMIKAKSKTLHRKGLCDIIIIDYLQLIKSSSKTRNREDEVSKISRELKSLAKELNVPLIALAQLNRESERRADKRPALGDLRESGGIEADADLVILLHRPEMYGIETTEKGHDTKNYMELIVAKHRNGRVGTVYAKTNNSKTRFYDFSDTPEVINQQLKTDIPF